MRKLLIIILLLGSLPAFAQTTSQGWKPQNFKANNRDSSYFHKDVNFNSSIRIKENALRIGLVTVSANGTELNLLDGALVNTNELNNLVGVTGKTGTGNLVLSASPTITGTLGGNLALGTHSLTMTGSLAATGSRVLKGWFTDLEITNLPTVNGATFKSALSLTATDVGLGNVTNESKATMFTSPAFTGSVPTAGGIPLSRASSVTSNLSAGALTDINLGVSTDPYNIQLFSSGGSNLTGRVADSVALSGGTYHLYVYSVDALSNVKIKFLY